MPDLIRISRPSIGEEEIRAVERVLRSGNLTQGPEVEQFELEFRAKLGLPGSCVAVSSGTDALVLGLRAAGIGPGDAVVVPSFTFAGTVNAVVLAGATPLFADIDPHTYGLDAASVEAVATPATRAVLAVHLYGHPADLTALGEVARRRGLLLFEDAAQAHGARWHGRPVGSFGSFGAFSFYATKNLTTGEGGMVCCAEDQLRDTVRILRNQGMTGAYQHVLVGQNARMTELAAAIGREQVRRFDDQLRRRRSNARFLAAGLRRVQVPTEAPGARHVYHQFTVRIPEGRDRFREALRDEHAVESRVYYPTPAHLLAPFRRGSPDLPETLRASRECLSLPVHPGLTPGDLHRIVEAVDDLGRAGS